MLRKLLTCLALLTGLAATGTPAQAEVAVALASQMEASTSSETVSRAPLAITAIALPRRPQAAITAAPAPQFERPALLPAVHLGSDRARE